MENKLMVAKSYRGAERVGEPFEKNGKLYTKVKEKCDRCSGHGIIVARVENGQPIPIPVDGGICYSCWGKGYFIKEVRLYTEQEYERMEAANEKARQKKVEEREAKMKAEFAGNRIKWLDENGFNADEITYIYIGADSYQIKDELKDAGFRFSANLKWHKATKDEKYADHLIEVKLSDIAEWGAWGKASFNRDAQKIVEEKIAAVQPKSTSEWIGKVGDKLKDIKVQLTRKYSFDGKYGVTTVYNFVTEDGNNLTWFSSTYQPYDIGEWMKIKYTTIKDHNEYKGVKSTVITRTKLVNIDPGQEMYDKYNWENEILNG